MVIISKNMHCYLLQIWMVLFVFQNWLERISPIFSYIDELPLLLLFFTFAYNCLNKNKIIIKKSTKICHILILIFVISGLAGNILYQYQKIHLVIIDVITNLKFWGAIAYFEKLSSSNTIFNKKIFKLARWLTIILFVFFLLDRFITIFPAEYRYGIKSSVLFYSHPTYFAGVCAFLASLLVLHKSQINALCIVMNLLMMIFTLRSKAIVSVIVFVLLYFIIIKLRGKLKIWQIISMGIIGIICAWSQIYFYFIRLAGNSARSVMLVTSLKIMRDYLPIGTGFGTFASHSAAVNYSPVYVKYGFEMIYELRNSSIGTFFDDQFWPIIFGQTGLIGTICYLCIIIIIFKNFAITIYIW